MPIILKRREGSLISQRKGMLCSTCIIPPSLQSFTFYSPFSHLLHDKTEPTILLLFIINKWPLITTQDLDSRNEPHSNNYDSY